MTDFAEKVSIKNVRAIKQTAGALLCVIGDRHHWIPQSQIDDDSPVFALDHEGTLVVSEWCATAKGLV